MIAEETLEKQIADFNLILKKGDQKAAILLQEAREYVEFAKNIGWVMTFKEALQAVFIEKTLKKELSDNWPQVLKTIKDEAPAFRKSERIMKSKISLVKGRPRKRKDK